MVIGRGRGLELRRGRRATGEDLRLLERGQEGRDLIAEPQAPLLDQDQSRHGRRRSCSSSRRARSCRASSAAVVRDRACQWCGRRRSSPAGRRAKSRRQSRPRRRSGRVARAGGRVGRTASRASVAVPGGRGATAGATCANDGMLSVTARARAQQGRSDSIDMVWAILSEHRARTAACDRRRGSPRVMDGA